MTTPADKYRTILSDLERFLQERALRYFLARYHAEPDAELLKVQGDTLAMVLELYLKPHALWFEAYQASPHTASGMLVLDLDAEVLAEDAAHAGD